VAVKVRSVTRLPLHHPLAQVLHPFLSAGGSDGGPAEVSCRLLPASRPVFRFTTAGGRAAVGKFFIGRPGRFTADLSLLWEYRHYHQAEAWGLTPGVHLPRLLGRSRRLRLGLLLEDIPGPDLDHFLALACNGGGSSGLPDRLGLLARLLVEFHTRPVPAGDLSPAPALAYLAKLRRQLGARGLLTPAQDDLLEEEGRAWGARFAAFADRPVPVHGDATPTNFLFPDGRAVAVDLERLRVADRLFDLSWVAAEIRHAWGWRAHDLKGGEEAIGSFFRSYLTALNAAPDLARRLFALNPFYMALGELRICRNAYLSPTYRRRLLAEALECLAGGRRLAL